MKVGYELLGPDGSKDPKALRQMQDALNALPIGLQYACYGAGFKQAGTKTRRLARAMCPPGKRPPITRKGRIRKRLRDSIRVKLVSWRWRGRKVPKSAVVVLALMPHAHLVERGVKHWKDGPRPFLEPALEAGGLADEFRKGCQRQFGKVVDQVRRRKLTKATARALKLKESDPTI